MSLDIPEQVQKKLDERGLTIDHSNVMVMKSTAIYNP